MTKTTKGGKVMNPTDAHRKELRKKELKRNKKERKKVREVGILKKDPDTLKEQIDKLQMMKADGALDKARKHKKRQLEDTLNLVLKKRKEHEEKQRENGETPVMFSHLGLPRRLSSAEEEERDKHPQPEDSVYFHPTLNPTGAPPPGKPPMFKSSIGPRIPLSEASSSGTASTSMTESDDVSLAVPPPPPPPPLPNDLDFGDGSIIPTSLPLPPPPPLPPKSSVSDMGKSLPPPPFPPPSPGDPHTLIQHSSQPPPPGVSGSGMAKSQSTLSDNPTSKEPTQVHAMLPPPPPGLPLNSRNDQSEGALSESNAKGASGITDFSKVIPPPPPPRQLLPLPGPPLIPTLRSDLLPPGISRHPPLPPPSDMRPPLLVSGIPMIPRPPFGLLPGLPPMMRPPLPPGPPPFFQEDDYATTRPYGPPLKPSYVKSAASTVVKRPLAQHTPELTSMIPASVRVRRETAVSKPKPRSQVSTIASVIRPTAPASVKPEPVKSSSTPKAPSIDDSYMAFLEDMKVLGALDG